jgi:hypothetical protein
LERRIVVNMVIQERMDDGEDVVRFQMPEVVYKLVQAEARRTKREFNTVIRDVVCDDLTRRALAIRALNEQRSADR